MDYETITYSASEGVATVTLSRPDSMNAITPQMLEELDAAVVRARDDDSVRVVVITGAGRAFSAGVDLKALRGVPIENGGVGPLLDEPARRLTRRLRDIDAIAVARVNGYCFTGALEIALACDLIVVAEEAKLGDTHAQWGLRPSWGMSARLPALVGPARARELSLTARTFTGGEAAAMGLAVRAVPLAELDAAVHELTARLLDNSPGALAAYKRLYDAQEPHAALEREASTIVSIDDTEQRLAKFR